ncbi:gp53-like domain-containing protein [Megasphaera elsdenii]|uniref:gp53-like domain-containing protein n=1 Tax=Megasphaera elsdenii TaxID=907 RepID=UPI002A800093|nr:hypothetical protein [Megasphaera elsdenii]MDY4265320.1 hypothetical protein [Megasphaera elsdenii]
MSILKGILHHWNKTNSAYDTIHPETEVAQVTDWNNGIVNTLASTALGTLVNTLTSDSLLATMIQKVLTATGVKYSMGQNGYICFGSLFGGLIIQWGNTSLSNSDGGWVYFPLTFPNAAYILECSHYNSLSSAINVYLETSFLDKGMAYVRSDKSSTQVHFLAVGH